MVTKILLIIMLVLYIALLIMRYKKKDNPKIEGGVQVVQGYFGLSLRLTAGRNVPLG